MSAKKLSKTLLKISKTITKNLMWILIDEADTQIEVIKDRSAKGIDLNGQPFKPYNKRYAKWKKENYAGQTWLRLNGFTMRSMGTKIINNRNVQIKFTSNKADEIAGYNSGRGRVTRSFFGYTDKEAKTGEMRVIKAIMKEVQSVFRKSN